MLPGAFDAVLHFDIGGVLFHTIERRDVKPGFPERCHGALRVADVFQAGIGDHQDAQTTQGTCEFSQAVHATGFDDDPTERLIVERRKPDIMRLRAHVVYKGG